MCQTGAIGMSRRGFTAGQILAHYYPGAELASLPEIAADPASGAAQP
jgi:peptidoglycan hydrolase-like amidase